MLLLTTVLYAQNKEERYTVRLTGATLEEFTKTVEHITGYSFIYGEEVQLKSLVTLDAKEKSITEILNQALMGESITYTLTNKHIILKNKTDKPKPVSRKFTISGYVTDGTSSETLIGANIYEFMQKQGTATNPYGFYTLTLPEGKVELIFSYLGYDSYKASFALQKDTVLHVKLGSDNVLEEVVIVSDRIETGIMATHTGAVDIPVTQIKNTPTILSEPDVMKTIQLIPGVQAGVEGSAGLYVRGGSPDQNLILLDGVPIYNVDHVLGFFSVFTAEAVKKVSLFKGSFPARFGGRLSSVVDVRTNDGDMKTFHGSISLGLLTTKLNFEGPIRKDKTAFNVSLRRSYLDWATRPFMKDDFKGGYYFYDINAKVNHKLSDKNRLFLSFYHGNDYYNISSYEEWNESSSKEEQAITDDKISMRWGNMVIAARWNNVVNNKLFSNTTLAFNEYRLNMDAQSSWKYKLDNNSYHTNYNSGIRDWSFQTDFDYTPHPEHHIKFGATYLYHNFHPEVMTSKVSNITEEARSDTLYKGISNSKIYAHELSVYAEDNFDLTPKLRTNIGFHLSGFHVQGKTYMSIQPRLALRYQLDKNMVLKASYSKMNQYINLLTSAPISMPTDLWVPVTKNIKPMLAHQYSLGAYYNGIKNWEFSMEGYYKEMKNVLEYKEATRFIGSSSSWEEKVEMGSGRSYGIELMAQRTAGKTTGWLSYTLAKSDRKFAKGGINNGERFPFKYDRRHMINLMLNHAFSQRVDVGVSWYFASGGTTTIAQEVGKIIRPDDGRLFQGLASFGYSVPVVTDQDYIEHRNNYRLPSSHRLNIGINLHKKTKHGVRTWNFSVHNLYNAMNPTFIYRTVKLENEGSVNETLTPVIKKFTLLPLFPSVSYTYRF